ncbi:hypothetical protein EVAR_50296_1 [Eumeta japonica]|uniref:Uncharacterized protein n=1 Tax=Eumeta variegata TaxID=151549 RepID=A0A4C1XUQ8_EUMVA|nr:hypothetical protein EVAR_50296_1 [Eumeta japonica]
MNFFLVYPSVWGVVVSHIHANSITLENTHASSRTSNGNWCWIARRRRRLPIHYPVHTRCLGAACFRARESGDTLRVSMAIDVVPSLLPSCRQFKLTIPNTR